MDLREARAYISSTGNFQLLEDIEHLAAHIAGRADDGDA